MNYNSRLISELHNDNVVIFAGSGTSLNLGLPNWIDLLTQIVESLKLDHSNLEHLTPLIKSGEIQPLVALNILKKHRRQILETLEKTVKIPHEADFSLHQKILDLSPRIITTNYDKAFETALHILGKQPYIISNDSEFKLSKASAEKEYIFKIHGSIDDPEKCILFEEQYKKLYDGESAFLMEFKKLLTDKTILFIGFSMSDPFIDSLLNTLNTIYNSFNREHYLITTDSGFVKEGIQPLFLESYKTLPTTIDELAAFKKQTKSAAAIVSPPVEQAVVTEQQEDDLYSAMKLLLDQGKKLNYNSSIDDIRTIKDLQEKFFGQFSFIQGQIDNIPNLLEKNVAELFNSIFSNDSLSNYLTSEISNIRTSTNYLWYHRSLIVSALTLSELKSKKIDSKKIFFLFDFINDAEDKVWQKAITGLTLILTVKKNGWLRYGSIVQRLKGLKENTAVQEALKCIAFVFEHSLYEIYTASDKLFQLPFFKDNPANCFIPFYNDNPAIQHFLDESDSDDPQQEIAEITDAPLPDLVKYALCYRANKTKANAKQLTNEDIERLQYVMQTSHYFEPYLQILSELYLFNNLYPNEKKQQIFSQHLSLGTTSLKDYVLAEAQKHSIQGQHYLKIKDYKNAINHFVNSSRYSKQIDTLHNLAVCYSDTNDIDQELLTRLEIKKMKNDDAENLAIIARLYLITNKYDAALSHADQAIKLDSNSTIAYDIKNDILLERYAFNDSFQMLNKAITNNPTHGELYLTRAETYRTTYDYENAISDNKKALELLPNKKRAYLRLGVCYGEIEHYHEAINYFNKAIDLDPDDASGYLFRGIAYKDADELDNARTDFETAIKLDSQSSTALVKLGYLLMAKQDYTEAMQQFDLAISKNRYGTENYLAKGLCYLMQDKFEKAQEIFDQVKKRNSQDAFLLLNYATFYQRKNEIATAFGYYDQMLALKSDDINALSARSKLHFENKQYNEAVKDLSVAINKVPTIPSYYVQRAEIYKHLNKFEDAIADLTTATKLKPYLTSPFITLAELYSRTGQFDNALHAIENMPNKERELHLYYGTLAEIHSRQNNQQAFISNAELALKNNAIASAFDADIREKHKMDPEFLELLTRFGQSLS